MGVIGNYDGDVVANALRNRYIIVPLGDETAIDMKPLDYFASHPVFRFEEFAAAHQAGQTLKPESSLAAVKQHVRAGTLLRVRRGLYAVVPRGQTPDDAVVDPYLLASNAAPDAVVAHHGALQFHGKAHSLTREVPFRHGARVAGDRITRPSTPESCQRRRSRGVVPGSKGSSLAVRRSASRRIFPERRRATVIS